MTGVIASNHLAVELHLLAGLGAVALGGGALLRGARRARGRLFAALCAAFALWTLAFAAFKSGVAPDAPWRLIFLIGSCLAAPIGLHFSLALIGRADACRAFIGAAYILAGLLYLSAVVVAPRYESPARHAWNYAAVAILGGILLGGLGAVIRQARRLPPGRERSALRLFLVGALIAVLGGLSDFLPRGGRDILTIGPVAVLAFLVIVCALVVRHRFLDVDVFIVRALIVAGSSALAAFVIASIVRRLDGGFLSLFATMVVLALLVGPTWRFAMEAGASRHHPVSRALMEISRSLATAASAGEIWKIVEVGLGTLRGRMAATVFLLDPRRDAYSPVLSVGLDSRAEEGIPAGAALPRLLLEEAAPLTLISLREMAGDRGHARQRLAEEVLAGPGWPAEIMVPLLRDRDLLGWIAAGGGRPETYVRSEVAAALLAVAYQTVASLERLEAVEAARRREALAFVGEMAAGLAHEIRNPLAAIHGAAQVIATDGNSPRSAEMIEVIRQESERLGRVVGDFLDYAHPGCLRRDPLDLAELAGRALRAAEAAGLGLRTTVTAAPDAPRAAGDPDPILRAFANLIRNAREAAGPDGRLEVEVSRHDGHRVAIRFSDNGPGIDPSDLARVFQPFFTRKHGGHGLGLALVHRVAEAHAGEVRVESRPGSGAAFTLILPEHRGSG